MYRKLFISTSFVLVLALVGSNLAFGDVVEIRIADGNDDVEQHLNDGRMDITSSDLELPYEDAGTPTTDEQVIGLRFVGVAIPKGAQITSAYVEFEVDKFDKEGSQAPVNLVIEGELAPDAPAFADIVNNVTDRVATTAKAKWSIPPWTEQNVKFQSSDISSVIQEIVNQDGWASGNALVLMLRDDKDNLSTGLREAESFDGEAPAAPLLHIEYTEAAPPAGATITVEAGGDIAAANAAAVAGDVIDIAAGTFVLTEQIEIKDGVTYQGAGVGLTIIDGGGTTRAFVAWGDRSATNGQVDENGVGVPNTTGPKDWVLDGMTIQNCVSDTEGRQDILSAARDLLNNYTGTPYTLVAAQEENGGIMDNPGWFDILSGGADDNLTDVELQAYLDANPVGSAGHLVVNDNKSGDGGAISIDNGAVGTIQNCEFLNNHTPAEGDGDDGGAINITGLSIVTINNCLFDGNYACSPTSVEIEGSDGDAGHIKVQGASASAITPGTTLIANHCVFLNGNAEDDGGAIQQSAVGTVVRLDACWFEANTSWDNGNVCQFSNNAQNEVTVTNCIFANNITKADNSPDRMIETNRNSKFINCTFVGNNQNDQDMIYNNANTQDTDGDGVDDETADATQVINCIFANNVVGNGDHVLGSRNDSFTIAAVNCLFFGNKLQNGNAADNTQRPAEETGSVSADPLLDANYVPGAGSPAIDAGVDVSAEGVMTDYNGNPRPQGAAYDIGAYEASTLPEPEPTPPEPEPTPPAPAEPVVLESRVADGNDDVEQHLSDGRMDITSSDLELPYEDAGTPTTDEQVIGLRFVGVAIPKGAQITSAYIEFEVDKFDKEGSQAPVNLVIEGELAPDAPAFVDVVNNVTDRVATTAKAKWSIPPWTEQNVKFQSSDISAVIQEIVNQDGWASGNALVLMLRDDKDNPSTGLREAESFDGEAPAAPLLHIEYVVGEAPTPPEPEPTPPEPEPTPPEPEPTPPEPEPTPGVIERRISAGSDDAEERDFDDGYEVELDSSDLELGYEDENQGDPQVVGLRFTDITIPKGTKIKKAWVQFEVDETKGGTTPVFIAIYGELSPNAATFSKAARDITSRPRTTTSTELIVWQHSKPSGVLWDVPDWTVKGEQGPAQRTSDIADVIQEIVDQDGWVSGNSLVLIFDHSRFISTGVRCAEAFEGKAEAAPLLHIEHAVK